MHLIHREKNSRHLPPSFFVNSLDTQANIDRSFFYWWKNFRVRLILIGRYRATDWRFYFFFLRSKPGASITTSIHQQISMHLPIARRETEIRNFTRNRRERQRRERE